MKRFFSLFLVVVLVFSFIVQSFSYADVIDKLNNPDLLKEEVSFATPTPTSIPSPEAEIDLGEEPDFGILSFIIGIIKGIVDAVNLPIAALIVKVFPTIDGLIFNTNNPFSIDMFKDKSNGLSNGLTSYISSIYNALRYLTVTCYIVILVYLGVRMMLSSIGRQKAKYKELFKYWLVGLLLLFSFHWVMAFIIWISDEFVSILSNVSSNLLSGLTFNEGWLTIADDEAKKIPITTFIIKAIFTGVGDSTNGVNIGGELLSLLGCFITIIYLIMFAKSAWSIIVTYFRRFFTVIILIVLFPIIVLSYVFDKIGDRKAQTFQTWLKEFITNVTIQPLHALLLSFVALIFKFATEIDFLKFILSNTLTAPIFCLLCLRIIPMGEELLKKLFQISSQMGPGSNGIAGSAAKAGLALQGMKNLKDSALKIGKPLGKDGLGGAFRAARSNFKNATENGDSFWKANADARKSFKSTMRDKTGSRTIGGALAKSVIPTLGAAGGIGSAITGAGSGQFLSTAATKAAVHGALWGGVANLNTNKVKAEREAEARKNLRDAVGDELKSKNAPTQDDLSKDTKDRLAKVGIKLDFYTDADGKIDKKALQADLQRMYSAKRYQHEDDSKLINHTSYGKSKAAFEKGMMLDANGKEVPFDINSFDLDNAQKTSAGTFAIGPDGKKQYIGEGDPSLKESINLRDYDKYRKQAENADVNLGTALENQREAKKALIAAKSNLTNAKKTKKSPEEISELEAKVESAARTLDDADKLVDDAKTSANSARDKFSKYQDFDKGLSERARKNARPETQFREIYDAARKEGTSVPDAEGYVHSSKGSYKINGENIIVKDKNGNIINNDESLIVRDDSGNIISNMDTPTRHMDQATRDKVIARANYKANPTSKNAETYIRAAELAGDTSVGTIEDIDGDRIIHISEDTRHGVVENTRARPIAFNSEHDATHKVQVLADECSKSESTLSASEAAYNANPTPDTRKALDEARTAHRENIEQYRLAFAEAEQYSRFTSTPDIAAATALKKERKEAFENAVVDLNDAQADYASNPTTENELRVAQAQSNVRVAKRELSVATDNLTHMENVQRLTEQVASAETTISDLKTAENIAQNNYDTNQSPENRQALETAQRNLQSAENTQHTRKENLERLTVAPDVYTLRATDAISSIQSDPSVGSYQVNDEETTVTVKGTNGDADHTYTITTPESMMTRETKAKVAARSNFTSDTSAENASKYVRAAIAAGDTSAGSIEVDSNGVEHITVNGVNEIISDDGNLLGLNYDANSYESHTFNRYTSTHKEDAYDVNYGSYMAADKSVQSAKAQFEAASAEVARLEAEAAIDSSLNPQLFDARQNMDTAKAQYDSSLERYDMATIKMESFTPRTVGEATSYATDAESAVSQAKSDRDKALNTHSANPTAQTFETLQQAERNVRIAYARANTADATLTNAQNIADVQTILDINTTELNSLKSQAVTIQNDYNANMSPENRARLEDIQIRINETESAIAQDQQALNILTGTSQIPEVPISGGHELQTMLNSADTSDYIIISYLDDTTINVQLGSNKPEPCTVPFDTVYELFKDNTYTPITLKYSKKGGKNGWYRA